MTVEDVFDIRTRSGPVLTGKIVTGTVKVGDRLMAETAGGKLPVRVVAIEKFQHEGLKEATASPDDVGLEVTGITAEQARGVKVLRAAD
jgi:translation elongation factor EF-Tu-like GTPase